MSLFISELFALALMLGVVTYDCKREKLLLNGRFKKLELSQELDMLKANFTKNG